MNVKKAVLFIGAVWCLCVLPVLFADTGLLPVGPAGNQIIVHRAYTLSYSELHEQASWVAYELTRDELFGQQKRTDNFRVDPFVSTGSATREDYYKSGFDRGHLAPAADMKFSKEAMSESFYMSNISPQRPQFNRGIWRELESVVRRMAFDNNAIHVMTGPILDSDSFPVIGPERVSIPREYYKVILDVTEPGYKSIGFILPNQKSGLPLEHYAVPVDEVERRTGLDFFSQLPDSLEEQLEQSVNVSLWSFKPFVPSR